MAALDDVEDIDADGLKRRGMRAVVGLAIMRIRSMLWQAADGLKTYHVKPERPRIWW